VFGLLRSEAKLIGVPSRAARDGGIAPPTSRQFEQQGNEYFMCNRSQRIIPRALFCSVLFCLSLSVSRAGFIEGSTATPRPNVDSTIGQVFIYDGGFFDLGNSEQVTTFTWFGDQFSGPRFMTPLLIHELPIGVFTVMGIGTGRTVTSSSAAQSFAFGLTQGTDTTGLGGLWVFGFVNALLDNLGNQNNSSAGTVDMVSPQEGGAGLDSLSSNTWLYTATGTKPGIEVGTTFFVPGSNGNIALNDPSKGQANRTYSANLNGVSAAVPEPGTFALFIGGAALFLVGRRQPRRANRSSANPQEPARFQIKSR
jgi:hypothetical protein